MADAGMVEAAAEWLRNQPGYEGQLVRSRFLADSILGPMHPWKRNTPQAARVNACLIAAGYADRG